MAELRFCVRRWKSWAKVRHGSSPSFLLGWEDGSKTAAGRPASVSPAWPSCPGLVQALSGACPCAVPWALSSLSCQGLMTGPYWGLCLPG